MVRFSLLLTTICCVSGVEPLLAQSPAQGGKDSRQAALSMLAKLGIEPHPVDRFAAPVEVPSSEKKVIKLAVHVTSPPWCKATDDDLKVLQQVPEITNVTLESSLITDAALQWLPAGLERLELLSDKFTDHGLETLKRFGRLEHLTVHSRRPGVRSRRPAH